MIFIKRKKNLVTQSTINGAFGLSMKKVFIKNTFSFKHFSGNEFKILTLKGCLGEDKHSGLGYLNPNPYLDVGLWKL